jgi:Putative adhesin/Domain of unknown function (DUF5668)
MGSPVQFPQQRPRRSMAGPLVLIIIGVIFLLGNMHVLPWGQLGQVFARFWPLLIIVWGVVKLIEHRVAQREGTRASGIGAGGVFLLIVLIILGLAATQALRVNWGEIRENIDFGDNDFPWFGHTYTFDDQLEQAFPAGTTLRVVNDRGAINVNASDAAQIRVVVHKRIATENESDAGKYNAATKPEITVSGASATLNANTHGAGEHSVITDLDITVPRKAAVQVSARRGDVSILGRSGDVDISNQRGQVTVSDVTGKVTLNLEHGSARVDKITSDVSVQGRGGDLSLEDIKGSLRISGEFDGIKLARIGSTVDFKSARTDMEFSKLDGDLDMDSDDLRASDLAGPVRLTTRAKDIRLNGISGDVRLENENGAVELRMAKLGSIQVSNRNSDIQIYVPEKAAFQLDARSRGGEVQSDFNNLKVNNGEDQGIATGAVGSGGPHLVINNEHGTIEIRRGSAVAEAPAAPHVPKPPRTPEEPEEPTEN